MDIEILQLDQGHMDGDNGGVVVHREIAAPSLLRVVKRLLDYTDGVCVCVCGAGVGAGVCTVRVKGHSFCVLWEEIGREVDSQ